MTVSPMFPLGTVLFPGMALPLHLFEPRYRQMIRDVLDGDRSFGVCLIERGSEVGGGDVRTGVGTLARVVDAEEQPDGRWMVVAVGAERIVVDTWLADDPYPRADIRLLPDATPTEPELGELARLHALVQRIRERVGAQQGRDVPPLELAPEPVLASYQLSHAAPVSELDRHRLLAADSIGLRLQLLSVLLDDAIHVLDRLEEEGGGGS